ncbi:hypothetical protein [Shewanella sp. CG12_big_fil_rev_8_21_14_0_65_47_15]|uniref:hypothetical protein n=1 Tax=Shewanella sp. CG12_big_fil_rev_8_21_14_0_65_47_15 TaxID=1975537 RepID=UPI000CC5C98A|nr:hypothetical protein [Shewanella sp. CG12_big_fil_rev_8_21_14_0_65_47_15]PIW59936.1 MAG: hypothetical protein COW15_14840 [Shewanella sp. CG12_big_fil_rev_8_21_14_0_65_47_15]
MALQMIIPNRPFSTEPITGMMLPDGIFEISLGKQRINAHFTNSGAAPVANATVYIESVSHPGIVITPATFPLNNVQSNVAHLFGWDADFSACSPGKHLVSFIVESGASKKRIIKQIFVTHVSFNTATKEFTAVTPEGAMTVVFDTIFGPSSRGCCTPRPNSPKEPDNSCCKDKHQRKEQPNVIAILGEVAKKGTFDRDFKLCSPYYLPGKLHLSIVPTPSFSGQFGDLPFQDPWWKVLIAIIAALLALGAAIAEAIDGSGDLTTSGTGTATDIDGDGIPDDCCDVGVTVSGGGSSYVAAGLLAAAAVVATIAAASDKIDPVRRGQKNTIPAAGEITIGETLEMSFAYPEPVKAGTAFVAGLKWLYTRITTGASYTYSATDLNKNVHVLTHYDIDAPDVIKVYKRERFIVQASFFDENEKILKGSELFVQCYAVGPNGELRRFQLQDHGQSDDQKANDGIYTGGMYFSTKDGGLWTYYVIAQDINNAQPDMKPEDAAQIVGGMVLTGQLTLSFDGGTCEFVPDGHVNVIVPN